MEESLHQLRRGSSRHLDADDAELMKRSLMTIRRIRQERTDQDLLHRTVMEACQFSYGTKMVEVWVWDSDESKLFRPEGGWWIDPYWHREGHTADSESCRFCQLVDAARTDFIAPPLLSPGVGIPGVLWSDLGRGQNTRKHRRRESGGAGSSNSNNSGIIDGNFLLQVFGNASLNMHDARMLGENTSNAPIAWRDVKALAEDPDQPQNHRLQVIAKADLRWTCGVPFKIKNEEGIVVFYARDTVNLTKLRDRTNTDYLVQASDFIGSAWALRLPRMAAVQRRHHEMTHNFQRVKHSLTFLIREGVSLHDLSQQTSKTAKMKRTRKNRMSLQFADVFNMAGAEPCHQTLLKKVKKKTRQSFLKVRGAGTQAPPTFGWKHTVLCTTGVLMSILTIGAVNDAMITDWGSDYAVPLGPMAALLGLQFGLTAAPAAQPRTIMVGQVVSILVALAFAEIPFEKVWIKQSLACAVAVGAMAKIGVVNPPAAANAFIFASGTFGFTNMAVALLSNLLAIFCAIFINNLSDKRQYPSFWGIPRILQCRKLMAKPMQKMYTEEDSSIDDLIRRTRARKMKAEQDELAVAAGAAKSTATDTVVPESVDESTHEEASSSTSFKGERIEIGDGTPALDRAEMGVVVKSSGASSMRSTDSAALGLDSDRSVRFHPLDTVGAEVPPSSSRSSTQSRHRRSKAFMNSV